MQKASTTTSPDARRRRGADRRTGRLQIDLPTTPESSGGLEVTITAVLTDSAGMPVQARAACTFIRRCVLRPRSGLLRCVQRKFDADHGHGVDWTNAPVGGQKASLTVDRITWTQTVRKMALSVGKRKRTDHRKHTHVGLKRKATYSFRPSDPERTACALRGRTRRQNCIQQPDTVGIWPEAYGWRSTGTSRIAWSPIRASTNRRHARILILRLRPAVRALVTPSAPACGAIRSSRSRGQTTIDLRLDEADARTSSCRSCSSSLHVFQPMSWLQD